MARRLWRPEEGVPTKKRFGSRSFRAAFLPHGVAREAATGLEMLLGGRPIERDRSGGERRLDGGGRRRRRNRAETAREETGKRESGEKKKKMDLGL
ncbi:hypothetical protein ACLB2K_041599 [Fragaria x ananassa]